MKEFTPEQIADMTVGQRLAEARVRFLEAGTKKSGVNLHAEFTYFELVDIVPTATRIFDDLGLFFLVSFANGEATGTLYDAADYDDFIRVSCPLRSIGEPGKFRMNEIQAAGAEITYYRRYLYMLILDIVEADKIDAEDAPAPAEKPAAKKTADKPKAKKPATKEEREEIKEAVTAPEEPASELQVEALRLALAKLLNVDPEQEDFIQEVMLKTEGLTKVTKEQAEKLTSGVSEMLENYTEAE